METNEAQNTQIEISPEFYQLLKQYTGSQDPLEDPNFDVAAYLNEKFPDFKSLDNINDLIEKFEKEIVELDEEIDGLMCERATYNDELKNYMQELNNDVGKIIQLISNIKQNTDTNETTVKLICNDIKNLDNARNNITVTISSLTKLIMLITGIEKLESFVKEKQYKEAANAIAASNDIMEYFKEYRHVTQVNSLYQKKDALCNSLLNTICDELKNDINLLPQNSDRLYDACLAVNAIGDRAIGEIKTWFTQYKLAPYEKMYDPKIENAIEFKDTEKRFDWLKRALKEYDKLYDDVFPPSWGFKSQLCQEFCRITKLQLNEILMMNVEGIKNIEVEVLVKVLNSTISFEKSLNEYLISEYPDTDDNIKSNFLDMNVIEEIRTKYSEAKSNKKNGRKDPNPKPRYRLFRVIGIISESFEPYMNSYVTNEEKKIKDIIINLVQNDRIEGKLYVSSLYLFNNIKQAMSRCLTFSKSKTFFDLSIKFKDIFLFYIEKILNQKFNLNFYSNEINKNKNLKQADFTPICYLINTCDYCITTIGALTSSVQEKIEEKYQNNISYDDIVGKFREIYKKCFDLLSTDLKNSVEVQLQFGIIKKNWVLGTSGGKDTNAFVNGISKILNDEFNFIKNILQEEFLCHYLNVVPKIISELLINYLYKIKKIDESGAQEIYTNIGELKNIILNLYYVVVKPVPGQNKENDSRYNCLNMILKKEMSRVENRLKTLGSNVTEFGNAYKNFVEDKSREDFDKLLQLRGIRKNDIIDYEKIFI
jgi:hypothetical protein